MMGEKRAERMRDLDKLRTEDDKVKAVAEPSEAQTQPPARMKLGESAPASFLCAPESASAGCAGNAMPLSTVVERMDR
jgi:hypothetical protein